MKKYTQQVIVGFIVLLFACSVQAKEPHKAVHKVQAAQEQVAPVEPAPVHEEAKTGLPQLDPSLYPGQIFWLVISFALLYVLMSRVALPSVQKTQANRHQVIQSDLGAAATANDQAKSMQAAYEKALAESRAKAQATISDLAASIAKEAAAQQATKQQELNHHISDAEAKIAATGQAAMQEASGAARDLANAIVEKISGLKAGA